MQTNVQIDSNAAHHIKHRDHITIEVSIFPPYFIINIVSSLFIVEGKERLFQIELRPYR